MLKSKQDVVKKQTCLVTSQREADPLKPNNEPFVTLLVVQTVGYLNRSAELHSRE